MLPDCYHRVHAVLRYRRGKTPRVRRVHELGKKRIVTWYLGVRIEGGGEDVHGMASEDEARAALQTVIAQIMERASLIELKGLFVYQGSLVQSARVWEAD